MGSIFSQFKNNENDETVPVSIYSTKLFVAIKLGFRKRPMKQKIYAAGSTHDMSKKATDVKTSLSNKAFQTIDDLPTIGVIGQEQADSRNIKG